MASRSYGQHCAIAKSLDLVGDRWTLLIVRDLLTGPKRYVDLHSGLAPIATDMLAGRLRDLERNGLVRKRGLPKPATGNVYELTADGVALEDVLNEFARWGRHLLANRDSGDIFRPDWLVRAVRAYVRPDRSGPDLVLRFAAPEGGATIRITSDGVEAVADDVAADVTLTGQADVLAVAIDPDQAAEMVAAGRLHIAGQSDQVRRLAEVIAPPRVRTSAV